MTHSALLEDTQAPSSKDDAFYTVVGKGWTSALGDLARPAMHTDPIDLGDVPTDKLIQCVKTMLTIRQCEAAIGDMVVSGDVKCPAHLAIGQEAVAVGVAEHLRASDRAFGCHRSHAHYLAMGASLDGLMAEVLGKADGCSRGFGGSMHLYGKEVGFYGSVPIVAGTVPLAVGAAMASKIDGPHGQDGYDVGVAFFGDGACEEGVVHESLNMAAAFKLPMVFVVENNLFSSHLDIHLRQPSDSVARLAKAANIKHAVIEGNDVVEVMQQAGALIQSARAGDGPVFIEAITYRWRGHVGPDENVDVGVRRTAEELNAWKKRDPIARLVKALEGRGFSAADYDAMQARVAERQQEATDKAYAAPWPSKDLLTDTVYAKPRLMDATPKGETKRMNYGQAIRAGHAYLLEHHPEVFVLGQGVWSPWYVGSSMTDLEKDFGKNRVVDTPISEAACTGAAVGAALAGKRPIVIHPRLDFMILASDAMVNQAAKWAHMLGGQDRPSVTIRGIINRGGEQGAQHSQALHSWYAHIPGLRVVMPASAADARDLFIAAVLSDDPVLYIDDRWLYDLEDDLPAPRDIALDSIGPRVVREGSDITLVAASYSVRLALEAADILAKQNISAEVIDMRVINPVDHTASVASVQKTGRLLAIDGGWRNCGFAAELIAGVSESVAPSAFKCAPQRLSLTEAPAPTSRVLEDIYYTSAQDIADKTLQMAK